MMRRSLLPGASHRVPALDPEGNDGAPYVTPMLSPITELEALELAHPDRRYEDDPRAGRRVLRVRLG